MANPSNRLKLLLPVLLVLSLGGCFSHTEPAVDAATLVVSASSSLKKNLTNFAKQTNQSRARRSELLDRWEMRARRISDRVEDREVRWQLVNDKTALDLLGKLRKNDAAIKADPMAGLTAALGGNTGNPRFAPMKVETKDLDTIIKSVGEVLKEESKKDTFKRLLKYGQLVKKEMDAIEKAQDASAEP